MPDQYDNSVQSTAGKSGKSRFSLSGLLSTFSRGPSSTGTEGAPSTKDWRVPDANPPDSFTVSVGSPTPVHQEGWKVDDFVIAFVANLVPEEQAELLDLYAFDIQWKDQKGSDARYPCKLRRLALKFSEAEHNEDYAITEKQHGLLKSSVNQTYNVFLKSVDYSMNFTRNMAYENIGQEKQHSLSVDLIKKDKPEASA